MKSFLPETYLIGLVGLLVVIAILVGRQLFKVRQDEIRLINLDKENISNSENISEIYELASVQIRKRLYPQAITTLEKALKLLEDEPSEAKAIIQNALGFALAAQDNFKKAIFYYKAAIKSKPDYPVAINNLAFAKQKLFAYADAFDLYKKVLIIDPENKTARKQLKRIESRNLIKSPNSSDSRGF